MTYDIPEKSRLNSKSKPTRKLDYGSCLRTLLSVPGHAELTGVFAYNVQNHPDGSYEDGPIPVDPTMNTSQLYELGLVSQDGETITAFGRHVVSTVILDSAQLAEGRITPVIPT